MRQLSLAVIVAMVCATGHADDHKKIATDCVAKLKDCTKLLEQIERVQANLTELKKGVDSNSAAIKSINDQLKQLSVVKANAKKIELGLLDGQKRLVGDQSAGAQGAKTQAQTREGNRQKIAEMQALSEQLNRTGDQNTRIAITWRAYTPGTGVSRLANFRNNSNRLGSQGLSFNSQGLGFSNQNLGFNSQALSDFAPRISAERAVLPPLTSQGIQFTNQSANFSSFVAPQTTQQVVSVPQQTQMFMTPQHRGAGGFSMYAAPMVSPGSFMMNTGQSQALQSYSIQSAPVTQSFSIQSLPITQSYSIQSAPVIDSQSVRFWRFP